MNKFLLHVLTVVFLIVVSTPASGFVFFSSLQAAEKIKPYPYLLMKQRGYKLRYSIKNDGLYWQKSIDSFVLTAFLQLGRPLFSVGGHYYRFSQLPYEDKYGILLSSKDYALFKKVLMFYEEQLATKTVKETTEAVKERIVVNKKANAKQEQKQQLNSNSSNRLKDNPSIISKKFITSNTNSKEEGLSSNYQEDSTGMLIKQNIKTLKEESKNWQLYQQIISKVSKSLQLDNKEITTVIIDPGHGGKDAGAVAYGYEEKKLNLRLAFMLRSSLQKENRKLKVVLTRVDDRYLSLERRVNLANQAAASENAVFVSLHHNIWFSSTVRGLEMYYLHHEPEVFADISESSAIVAMQNGYRGNSAHELVRWKEMQRVFKWMTAVQYQRESVFLSERMLGEVRKNIPEYKIGRGVKSEVFFVLKGVLMPSVLIEGGFISNPEDLKFLTSSRGGRALAENMAKGIIAYVNSFSASGGFTSASSEEKNFDAFAF